MQMKADVQSTTERNALYKLQGFNLNSTFPLGHRCPYNIKNIHCHHDINTSQMLLITDVNKLHPIEKKSLTASNFFVR